MADFVVDSFTATNGTFLEAHTGETGATWTIARQASSTPVRYKINSNRAYSSGMNTPSTSFVASGTAITADYDVTANVHFFSDVGLFTGMTARAANPGFSGYWLGVNAGKFKLRCYTAVGVFSELGVCTTTPVAGTDYALTLRCRGDRIKVYVNGTREVNIRNNLLPSRGYAGLLTYQGGGTTTGLHFSDFTASNPVPAGAYNFKINHDFQARIPKVKESGTFVEHHPTVKL